jgi:hypothetical protein
MLFKFEKLDWRPTRSQALLAALQAGHPSSADSSRLFLLTVFDWDRRADAS